MEEHVLIGESFLGVFTQIEKTIALTRPARRNNIPAGNIVVDFDVGLVELRAVGRVPGMWALVARS
jgi:hypothetical protein